MKPFIIIGSLCALSGVALGAFGAHGLRTLVSPELLTVWQTGVQYHLVHALGILLVGLLSHFLPAARQVRTAGWLLLLGILLFSGSLYLMVLTGIRSLGIITPLGGVSFLAGWLLLALAAWRHSS